MKKKVSQEQYAENKTCACLPHLEIILFLSFFFLSFFFSKTKHWINNDELGLGLKKCDLHRDIQNSKTRNLQNDNP